FLVLGLPHNAQPSPPPADLEGMKGRLGARLVQLHLQGAAASLRPTIACRRQNFAAAATFRPLVRASRHFAASAGDPEAKAEGAKAEEAKTDEAKTEEAKPEETKAADVKAAEAPEDPAQVLQDELTAVQEKVRAKKHELLLSLADYENNKKKYLREREDRRKRSTTNFATKTVEVYAEFDRFATPSTGGACQGIHEGVSMVRDLFK
ncbi:unnamed protein product, partial [Polarella glacialis]